MAQDNIDEIKSKVDVVDLIQEFIQLKPAGTNNFKANCPFHHEKTPSFMVSRDKQIWHCFGCGEGGDIFGFLMKMEGLEFPEALRILAKKAGVQLQYQDPAISNQKTKLQDICRAAARFYHKVLVDHPKAKVVRDYLKGRQMKDMTIETWQLGYAPEAWDTLNKYLVQKGYNEEDIFLAGLSLKKDRGVGYIDRFRNRLMFPIWDIHGNVIGFGGRWLGEDKEGVAKYINSPQTLIYDKSRVLYGIDKARQDIKKEKLAVVVEGYMDCISSHEAGVTNVVASSGTALTPEQVRLLKRYSINVAFAFDQDLAGDNAAKRGIEVAWQEEISTKIIRLPQGKDPDELIKKDPAQWPAAIAKAQSIMEFYFESTLAKADLDNVEDKKKVAKILLNIISKLADPIEQTHYIQKLAGLLQVEEEILRDKLGQILNKQKKPVSETKGDDKPAPKYQDRFAVLAERIIGIALTAPVNLTYIIDHLLPEEIMEDKLVRLYKNIIIHYTKKQVFDYKDFIKTMAVEDSDLAAYAEVLSLRSDHDFSEEEDEFIKQEVVGGVKDLKRHSIQVKLVAIQQKLSQSEKANDKEAIDSYTQEFSKLSAELNKIS
ncbi:DNA primase [Patescibacteria group bacterium]|nr:DNA primase [Patescibacteria group bacterium]